MMFGRAMGSEAVPLPNKIVKSSVTHVNQKMCKFKVPTFEQKLISRRLQNIKEYSIIPKDKKQIRD
jgi:hypothetical protein